MAKRDVHEVRVEHLSSDDLFDAQPPPSEETPLETISGSEAARLLREGQPLRQKKIVGDVVVGQEDLQDPFEFELDGGEKVVLAGLPRPSFTRVAAPGPIEIQGCLFTGRAIFAGLRFRDPVAVSSSTFQAGVEFHYSQFDKGAVFYRCRFQARAKFTDAVFLGGAHFERTRFDDRADFYNGTFHEGASFRAAVFQALCTFEHSRFGSPDLLQPCLDFRNSVCHEAVILAHSTMEKIADFAATQFRRQADFSGTVFRYVNFTNTEFQRLDLKWEQIAGGRLLFGDIMLRGIEPGRPSIEMREMEALFEKRPDVPLDVKHRQYDILKAIFTKQGDYVSADGCFYEWKQVERRKTRLGWNPENWIVKSFHYLNWLSCGYGAKPIRTVLFAGALVLLFALAYSGVDLQTGGSWLSLPRNLEYSFRNFMNFGPVDLTRAPMIHVLTLIDRLLGWLTLFLFITTYTRIMLR